MAGISVKSKRVGGTWQLPPRESAIMVQSLQCRSRRRCARVGVRAPESFFFFYCSLWFQVWENSVQGWLL